MAALVAVLFAAWTWGPITSKGSVCFSSLFAGENSEGISTATYVYKHVSAAAPAEFYDCVGLQEKPNEALPCY